MRDQVDRAMNRWRKVAATGDRAAEASFRPSTLNLLGQAASYLAQRDPQTADYVRGLIHEVKMFDCERLGQQALAADDFRFPHQ